MRELYTVTLRKSFLNYDIFEYLIEHFKLDRDQEDFKYPEKLKAYVKKQRISGTKPALSKYTDDMMKLTLVLDIDSMCRLDKLLDIAKAVAKILGVLPSTFLIYDIRESCVEVTFLILKSIAESMFSNDEIFSNNQNDKFRQLLVKQILFSSKSKGLNYFCLVQYATLLGLMTSQCR